MAGLPKLKAGQLRAFTSRGPELSRPSWREGRAAIRRVDWKNDRLSAAARIDVRVGARRRRFSSHGRPPASPGRRRRSATWRLRLTGLRPPRAASALAQFRRVETQARMFAWSCATSELGNRSGRTPVMSGVHRHWDARRRRDQAWATRGRDDRRRWPNVNATG
jgi:hypothetical protein